MAGVEGFEPPNAWTKTMCLTTWRHPKRFTLTYCSKIFRFHLAYFPVCAYDKTMHKRYLSHGFTLIELLVVVTIIIILTGVSIVGYTTVLKQTHDSKRQSDMTTLAHALEIYYQKNGQYPAGCLLSSTCQTYDTSVNNGSTNGDPDSFTSANAVQINGSMTLSQLKTLLPGIDDSFGDPLGTSTPQPFINNQNTTAQNEYVYIGGLTNPTSSPKTYYVDFNNTAGASAFPLACQIWVTLPGAVSGLSSTSSYIIGYVNELGTPLWHLYQGAHGAKFNAGSGSAPNSLFCWNSKYDAVWAN